MKNRVLCLSLFWLSCFNVALVQAYEPLAISFPATDISGTKLSTQQSLGKKPIYIKFWASWCVPCNEQMPHFVEAYHQYGEQVEFLSVNIDINDDKAAVESLIKKYGLTMPTVQDHGGQLSKELDLLGTPMHILINRSKELVHRGHEVDAILKKRLKILAVQDTSLATLSLTGLKKKAQQELVNIDQNGVTVLHFTSSWCDWYLAESRPAQSKNCIQVQKWMNSLKQKNNNLNIKGVISRLWTEEKDVLEFKNKNQIKYPLFLDKSNQTFLHYKVNKLPTLLVLNKGQVVLRVQDFAERVEVEKMLKKLMK
ncbi:TlpA family protein disulfide reductase [Aliikangiella sp. IMCC44359]|uniref:TlpA family protein disulfide reductase n=1 Tax=Aliikangiella sp. IMCC44359 TaxID=3459125 RepID=UPI00403A847F